MSSDEILVVRPGALGDTILVIPLIHTIRNTWPDAHIVFLGTSRYRDVLPRDIAFQDFDAVEWLWLFEQEEGGSGRSERSFDRAYVILSKPETVAHNLLRAGTRKVMLASSVPRSGTPMVVHLHERLGLPAPQRHPCLGHMARDKPDDTIWVHPGSGGPSKCIPLPLMAHIASQMKTFTGYRLVVTASAEDAFLTGDPGWETLVCDPGTIVLKDLPLNELCRHVGSPRLFLGNDSGISHLAAALRVPAVVFFVRTDPLIWAPWTGASSLRVMDMRDQDLGTMDASALISDILEFTRKSVGPLKVF